MIQQEVMELIQRCLDEDLTEEEHAELMAYLAKDSESMALFKRMQHLSDNLHQLPKVKPPYSIVDSIMPRLEKMDKEISNRSPAQSARKRPYPIIRWASIAAAAVVLGLLIANGGFPISVPTADQATMERSLMQDQGEMAGTDLNNELFVGTASGNSASSSSSSSSGAASSSTGSPSGEEATSGGDGSSVMSSRDVAMKDGADTDSPSIDSPDEHGSELQPLASGEEERGHTVEDVAIANRTEGERIDTEDRFPTNDHLPEHVQSDEGFEGGQMVLGATQHPLTEIVASPDERYQAIVRFQGEDVEIRIKNEAEELIYAATETGVIMEQFNWSDDSTKFVYSVHDGNERLDFEVDVETMHQTSE